MVWGLRAFQTFSSWLNYKHYFEGFFLRVENGKPPHPWKDQLLNVGSVRHKPRDEREMVLNVIKYIEADTSLLYSPLKTFA